MISERAEELRPRMGSLLHSARLLTSLRPRASRSDGVGQSHLADTRTTTHAVASLRAAQLWLRQRRPRPRSAVLRCVGNLLHRLRRCLKHSADGRAADSTERQLHTPRANGGSSGGSAVLATWGVALRRSPYKSAAALALVVFGVDSLCTTQTTQWASEVVHASRGPWRWYGGGVPDTSHSRWATLHAWWLEHMPGSLMGIWHPRKCTEPGAACHALGPPHPQLVGLGPLCSDARDVWRPISATKPTQSTCHDESLTVRFPRPVYATELTIHDSHGTLHVTGIDLTDAADSQHVVSMAVPRQSPGGWTACMGRVLRIPLTGHLLTQQVRLRLRMNPRDGVDAISLRGSPHVPSMAPAQQARRGDWAPTWWTEGEDARAEAAAVAPTGLSRPATRLVPAVEAPQKEQFAARVVNTTSSLAARCGEPGSACLAAGPSLELRKNAAAGWAGNLGHLLSNAIDAVSTDGTPGMASGCSRPQQAWAPRVPSCVPETITVTFDTPVFATELFVR